MQWRQPTLFRTVAINAHLKAASPPSNLGALVDLGRRLRSLGYAHTAVTPETHRRVLAREPDRVARDLRDVFGWSRPFRAGLLPDDLVDALERAGALEVDGALLKSTVRYATLDDGLYVHSAYPTQAADSVFFGPDTYRFVALIRRALAARPLRRRARIVDIGCGSGVGGLVAAQICTDSSVVLADINRRALDYAAVNAELGNSKNYTCCESDVLAGVDGRVDLIVSNPPYMADPQTRLYRHGGAAHGCELSLRILAESLARLAPGGRVVLYTGAAVVDGRDVFRALAEPLLREAGVRYRYTEIDPDVFGDELDRPGYADVERIAAVGLVAHTSNAHPVEGPTP